VALLLPLAVATRQQTQVWRSSVSLFEHALAWTKNNFVAHDNLATALLTHGRTREAMFHTLEALRIRQDQEPERYLRFGRALLEQRLFAEAAEVLEKALRMNPADPEARRLLAAARAHTGQ
jgi:tetratricopeptide (TPR) repeat protein